jgi:rhodanese-related sulfurtransferase
MTEASISRLLQRKRASLQRLTPVEAAAAAASDPAVVLVDTRPSSYRAREGAMPGALIIERACHHDRPALRADAHAGNVLEWRLDPTSPDAIPEALQPGFRPVIVCNDSYASSLAAASLQELGVTTATDMMDGFRGWKRAGLPAVQTVSASADRSQPQDG